MSKKNELRKSMIEEEKQILDKKEFSDPELLQILAHEKNQLILNLLIKQEMTIIDLKNLTKLNPGTIKRHLDLLIDKNLIFQSRIEINRYGIRMKYYRASAKQFDINIKFSWP
ncbi:MAG: ArsR family transcriptional regulator [Candidatus Lokiarchaeota archaeon]|nr:ArsR family transcriptional regulator [Candidatus Lokiarchaeota archaeon]